MQATKPIAAPTSGTKRCQESQKQQANNSNTNGNNINNNNGNCSKDNKSIAQRVMEVSATTAGSNNHDIGHAPAQGKLLIQQHSSGGNNSATNENDHEVETITTNRAIIQNNNNKKKNNNNNISPVNSNTSSNSNTNGTNNQPEQTILMTMNSVPSTNGQPVATTATDNALSKSTSSLIVVSPISSSSTANCQQQANQKQQHQRQQQQYDRFKPATSNNDQQQQLQSMVTASGGSSSSCQMNRAIGGGGGSSLIEPGLIALDTRVPHPHKMAPNGCHAGSFEDVEVSYYNDSLTLDQLNGKSCHEPKLAIGGGGSLDNSARPKLLLAASQAFGGASQMSSGNNNNKQQQQQQQRLHQGVVNNINCDKTKNALLEVYQNDTKENGQLARASYDEHNYMTADYDDLYDVHYDNAPMVEKKAAANKQQQQHQGQHQHQKDLAAGGYSRYQEISSPMPSFKLSPKRNNCFSSTTTTATHQAVSISTSPKAKSAPATPCNVTPIAFHQVGSHLSSMLNPNLANTLPPDIRKNISSTCRVLPSSIGFNSGGGCAGATSDPIRGTQQQQQHPIGTANTSQASATNQPISFKYLDSLIKDGEKAMAAKNYISAIKLFSQCINLATENQNVSYLMKNFKIYSHRAEAHYKLGNYNEAIDDSMAARELNPKWVQAYYLQGRAQSMIGRHADSLAVYSFGLTQDPNNEQLFNALLEAALNSSSSFRQEFEPKFNKLKSFQLDRRPFVVVAILGQELLAKGHSEHAAIILESALKLISSSSSSSSSMSNNNNPHSTSTTTTTTTTTTSSANNELLQLGLSSSSTASPSNHFIANTNNQKKFKSSVLSSISLAYCLLRDYDKAIGYMNKELDIESELEDINGQCRVLSNLGYTYYKVRKFDKSLEAHRKQLNLAMRTHLYPQASQALNAIGHVHAAKNDYANAFTSHTRCLDILKQLDDDYYAQFKEMLAIGHVHLMLNDLKAAEERLEEARQLLKQKRHLNSETNNNINQEEFTTGSIMINFNLAHLALRKHSYTEAIKHYESILKSTHLFSNNDGNHSSFGSATLKRATYEMRAFNGLGQACRLLKKFDEARGWFDKQLRTAKFLKDLVGQSRALCNLGMIYQQFDEHQEAWRLFDENLKLVDKNPQLKAYAHSYMGSAYYLMNRQKEAQDHYEASLSLFKELGYFSAEQQTIDQNLASIKRRPNKP